LTHELVYITMLSLPFGIGEPCQMIIGYRLLQLRESKKLSQGDIEKRTGLLRCYISRVENGHTVPSIETLEKMARALDISLYQVFYDGDAPLAPVVQQTATQNESQDWASYGKGQRALNQIRQSMGLMTEHDRQLLLLIARKMTRRRPNTR